MPKASGARPRVVVFTRGEESTIVASHGIATEHEVDVLPRDKVVDLNGAFLVPRYLAIAGHSLHLHRLAETHDCRVEGRAQEANDKVKI